MARKLRIQFEGAIYHVINRGNYRRDLFENLKIKQAFANCVFETAGLFSWRLYAYAVMRNHYHLVVETPQANLVEGMHRLQSAFGNRFNLYRQEQGHLFQGRYRAILVEPGPSLARVVNYVHLNPVRAGAVTIDQMAADPWISLCSFVKGARPTCLSCAEWLKELGLQDSPSSWTEYLTYLQELATSKTEQQRQGFEAMSRGWAVGTSGWRQAMAKEYGRSSLNRGYRREEILELRDFEWAARLQELQARAGKSRADANREPKGAKWKIAVAEAMRRTTTAPNAWIGKNLRMGPAGSVSRYLSQVRLGRLKIPTIAA